MDGEVASLALLFGRGKLEGKRTCVRTLVFAVGERHALQEGDAVGETVGVGVGEVGRRAFAASHGDEGRRGGLIGGWVIQWIIRLSCGWIGGCVSRWAIQWTSRLISGLTTGLIR